MLRLPVTYSRSLICFASGVRAILFASCLATCAPGRSEGPSGPGSLFNRRPELPVCLRVDVSGTSQVPRRSIPCLCPALRPRPNRRSLASLTVASVLPPRFPRRRLQRFMNFGAQLRGFGTCCLRFKSDVATTPAKLASGRLAWPLPGGRRTLWIATKGFRSKSHPPFLDLSWRKGSFIVANPFHSITSSASASSVGGMVRPAEGKGAWQVRRCSVWRAVA